MIAFCYEKLGQLHDAVQEYTKLLIAKPGYGQVFRKLFEIFVKNEKPGTVREFFDKYVEKTNSANFAILAQLYLDIGEFDTALQYLEEINVDIILLSYNNKQKNQVFYKHKHPKPGIPTIIEEYFMREFFRSASYYREH